MRLVLRGDLERTAARLVERRVQEAAEDLGREVARRVPPAHSWESMHDDVVRPSHVLADGQMIPGNLPFRLRKMVYQRGGDSGAGGWRVITGWDLADKPRDRKLPIHQRINCRCVARPVPGATARAVSVGRVSVRGVQVRGQVTIRFERIVESEFAPRGGGWARAAARATSARYRARVR